MFRHVGNARNHKHNIKLAALLSFIAGSVNVIGFLSVKVLTTNVTGHFAFFVEELQSFRFGNAIQYMWYVLAFFFGAFTTSFLIEYTSQKHRYFIFFIPLSLEALILFALATSAVLNLAMTPFFVSFSLLFAMGLQNALVTRVSNAVVRTTHLTGLFTDLGIELAQLLFNKNLAHQADLKNKLKLRTTIVLSFLIGGVLGGLIANYVALPALFLPATLLVFGFFFDVSRVKFLQWLK